MLICSSQVISIQKGLFSKWTVQSYSGQQAHLRNSSKHVTWQNDSASGGPGDSESRRGVRAPTGRRRGRLRVPGPWCPIGLDSGPLTIKHAEQGTRVREAREHGRGRVRNRRGSESRCEGTAPLGVQSGSN